MIHNLSPYGSLHIVECEQVSCFFLFKNSEREKIELNRVEQKRAEKPLRRFCLFVGKDEL
jgi:hypothetical protein